MKLLLLPFLFLFVGCTTNLELTKPTTFYNKGEEGPLVNDIISFDNLVSKCNAKKNDIATEYNFIAKKSNYWTFTNVTFGLLGEASLALLSINNSQYAKNTTIAFNAISVLLFGIKSASGIDNVLKVKKQEYDELNARLDFTTSTFVQARQKISIGDTTGAPTLRYLILNLRKECTACSTVTK